MSRLFSGILSFLLLSSHLFADHSELSKRRMKGDLNFLQSTFEVKYAPLEWKKEFLNFNLERAFFAAKRKVETSRGMTTKEFQYLVRELFNQTADYHVGVQFYSTESATLPFTIKSAFDPEQKIRRYFFVYVDYEALNSDYDLYVGDELIEWNGEPIDLVIQDFREAELGKYNTLETDQALAEQMLTRREGKWGMRVPNGTVRLLVKDSRSLFQEIEIDWDYQPEKIGDFTSPKRVFQQPNASFKQWHKDPVGTLKQSELFEKRMVMADWEPKSVRWDNPYEMGARQSYLPPLGRKLWKSYESDFFDAYIFRTQAGNRIGYVRIPHYMGDELEVNEFSALMQHFEYETDAIVIDQLNNPGGSIFYLYGLASTLATEPMEVPKQRLALTQEEVYMATTLLPVLDHIGSEEDVLRQFGETLGGYPVNFQFIQQMREFLRSLLNEWNQGHLVTEPLNLFGLDRIEPHPNGTYTKPVLLLINELDFSGGDFFPAILQDANRVTILGTRTAGAGGYVLSTSYPNHSGIVGFSLTGSLAERPNRDPIENLGVTADIQYPLTVQDLMGGRKHYILYSRKIIETLDSLVKAEYDRSA